MARGQRTPIQHVIKHVPRREVEDRDFDAEFSNIQPNRKLLRQKFAREYIKDFNATQSIMRMGYRGKAISQKASHWLRDPYTQWYLGQLMDKLDQKAIVTKNMVLMRLVREAHLEGQEGSHAARVSALRTLAKILGMEITKVEGNMSVNGGIMLVPFASTIEDWEVESKKSQATLKKAVRV